MASNIVRASDLDVTNIAFSDVRTLDNGGRMIGVSYKGNKMYVQLPALVASYGLSVWANEKPGGHDKMHLDLSLVGYDGTNPTVKTCFDNLNHFDEKVISEAMLNSKQWFKKNITTREVMQAIYTPLIKYSKDKETGEISTKYPPVVRLQIPRNKSGAIDVEVYDNNRNKLNFETVDFKRAQVTAIVQISSIWLISGKFGVTMKLQQMKVVQQHNVFAGYAFIEDSDDESS